MSSSVFLGDTAQVDSQSSIHASAKLGVGVSVGPWSIIGPNVEVGDHTKIGPHVVIESNTKLGKNNIISPYVSLGSDPQDLSYRGEETYLEIGDDNIIREFVTMNRGSAAGTGLTKVGDKNFFLAYSHVAHDCCLGNHILMINNATLAGHVHIDDHVILGAFSAVHQFCRIGAYSFLSQATQISKDVLPYLLVKGLPGFPCGLNVVGLKRHGFGNEVIRGLKKAYQILYSSGLKFDEVIKQLKHLTETCSEVQSMLDLIEKSDRGIARRTLKE
jgi:UDP-N-acetylglucosamine acyltransferase